MMQGGGHLALYDNHDALRREIARHSKRDAEAYDRYSRDVMRQCKFIKPLLMREPPDPTSFKPRDIQGTAVSGQALPRPGRGAHVRHAALLDHERGGFSRRIFRERNRQGAFRRQLHHRHGPGAALARHRLRAAASLHGRHRRHGRRLGFCARRHGRRSRKALGASFEASGGTIRSAAPVAQDPGAQRPRHRRGAGRRRGDSRAAGDFESGRAPHLPRDHGCEGSAGRVPAAGEELQDSRLVRQTEHRAGRPAAISRHPAGLALHSRRHARHRYPRNDGARLR